MAFSRVRGARLASPVDIMLARTCSLLMLVLAATCVGSKRSSTANGGPSSQAALPHADAGESPAPAATERPWIWGVTVDDPYALDATVDALASLPARPTARIVFDEGVPAATYRELVPSIHRVADVMGELLDSQFVANVSVDAYRARAREYLASLGSFVDIWEVGNEINGEWLGTTTDVVAKMSGAYDEVKKRNGRAALTLYYNDECWSEPDHEMFAWTTANVPASMRDGLDFVFVSYYEDDCNGLVPDWNAVFARLAKIFPNASLGFGECGTSRGAAKSAMLARYYGLRIAEPRFVGGYFWWYFSADMVPKTKPLWRALSGLMSAPR